MENVVGKRSVVHDRGGKKGRVGEAWYSKKMKKKNKKKRMREEDRELFGYGVRMKKPFNISFHALLIK